MSELRTESGNTIVGFGAGSLDLYPPPITKQRHLPPDYRAGGKVGWREEDETLLPKFMADSRVEKHVGGNVVNALAHLATAAACREVRFVGVLGEDDFVSNAISNDLKLLGITDHAVRVPGYNPSVGIVVRYQNDRMIRGRPRDPMGPYWQDDNALAMPFSDADIAVAASLKDPDLLARWLNLIPGRAKVSLNPGSSEFDQHSNRLDAILRERKVDLLALNEEEVRKLLKAGNPSLANAEHPEVLAEWASKMYARHVLCTLGKDGLILANNGEAMRFMSQTIDPKTIVDTLGAGDRAHAIAIDELLNKERDPQEVGEAITKGTIAVIQVVGGHSDCYPNSANDGYETHRREHTNRPSRAPGLGPLGQYLLPRAARLFLRGLSAGPNLTR